MRVPDPSWKRNAPPDTGRRPSPMKDWTELGRVCPECGSRYFPLPDNPDPPLICNACQRVRRYEQKLAEILEDDTDAEF